LPEGVDEDKIRARFENGVLEVTLQGVAAARGPRRVQIEGGQGPEGGQDVEVTGSEGSSGRRIPEGGSSGG
jgi:HSP20 family protein